MNSNAPVLSGLARRLVNDGLLEADLAKQAMAQAAKERIPFVQHLVSHKTLDAQTIARVASDEFGTPLFDLDVLNPESKPTKLVDQKLIRKHHTLPLMRRGNRLFVAVADPTNLHALDEIKFNTGVNTEAVLVEADKLERVIAQNLHRQMIGR
jgi:type IV pilus assembly protein PilB